ncbi:MAG: glycogen debranching N-terminal domain-containing protein [Candidatus Competibacteraceae bacterium]
MLIAYQGFSCFITNDFGAVADGKAGFFYRQTRFLARLQVKVNGSTPSCASGNTVDANSMIFYHLAPSPAGRRAGPDSDNPADDGGEMVRQGLELQVNAFVEGGLHLKVVLTNHTLAKAPVELSWELAADYADHQEVQSGERCQEAPVEQDWTSDDHGGVLSFRYAHLHLDHAPRVRFSGAGAGFGYRDGLVRYMTVRKSHTPVRLSVDVIPVFCGHAIPPAYGGDAFRARATEQDEARAHWAEAATRLSTPVAMVQRAWDRAACDLGSLFLLEGNGPERYMPAAGIPEYQALFGRDSLMTAGQCGLLGPDMLRGTLLTLRRWNATAYDDRYDEQPGKIVHQHQRSPLALLGKTPFRHYYGDYTAPALFRIDLASDFAWTGDVGLIRSTDEEITRTLTWMDRDGDLDSDGWYEYQTRAGNWGIKNQGWKDSAQAILYPDGRTVPDPIALIAIQGAYYAAKRLMGLAYRAIGEAARGTALLEQAAALKRRVNEHFWLPDEQYVALALDPDKKPVRTIAGDPGQALIYGVLERDKA